MQIHQVLSGAATGDAVTRIALNTRTILRRYGPSEIYAHHIDPSAHGFALPLDTLPPDEHPDDVVILHASIGDELVFDRLADRTDRLVLAKWNSG